jgi:Bacterial membrane protein YfhO
VGVQLLLSAPSMAETRWEAAPGEAVISPESDSPAESTPSSRFVRLVRSPSFPMVVMVAAVVFAHLPYLLGVFDPNPMKVYSGLTTGLKVAALPGSNTIDPNTGFTSQTFSHLAASDWLHGTVPWWNPTEGLGSPLAGTMKGMALFLPFVLLLHFAEGQIALYLAFGLIAALATYLLLRRLGISSWVSAAAGVAFGLNGTMAWNRFAAADPVCFLPLAVLGLELIRDGIRTGRPTRWWVAAIAIAMSIYAGFPETAYIDGLVIAVWALARISGLKGQQIRKYLLFLGAALVVGLMVAAPVLTALVDYLPHSFVAGHNGAYAHTALPRFGLANLMFPYIYGPIFGFTHVPEGGTALNGFWSNVGAYTTAATVALALVGLAGRRYRLLGWCLVGTAVLCIGRTYGIPPFQKLFNALPGMSHVAAYRYSSAAFEFCLIVVAAFGLEALIGKELSWRKIGVAFTVAFLLALCAYLVGRSEVNALSSLTSAKVWADASLLWGLGTLLLLLIAVITPWRLAGRIALIVLLPVEAIAMFMTPEFSTLRGGTVDLSVVSFLQRNTGLDRVYTLGPLQPEYGSYFGINSLNVNDVPIPKTYRRVVETELDPNANAALFTGNKMVNPHGITPAQALALYLPAYERLGVKYVVVPGGSPAPVINPPLRLVYHDAVADVYALPHPRAFYSDAAGQCAFGPMTYSQVLVNCRGPSVLTRNELQMPGWSARVGGRSVPVRADSDGVQTVAVPAGQSRVQFSFEPPHTSIAFVLALLGLALCVGSALAGPVRKRINRRRQPFGS